MKSRVGRRVEVEGSKGTVMYDGVVEGTKGRWLGIEWDDSSRGKHDGSHNGVVYFRAKGPTTASFVRETKANFGKSFMRAVNERYRTRLEPEVAAQMHVKGLSDQITAVQLVGNDKIAERQARIDQLEDVHVSDLRVCGIEDVEQHDPDPSMTNESPYPVGCASLGLVNCLLSAWDDVAAITRPMTRLQTLYLDENRISLPEETHLHTLVDAFQNLKVITLTKMDIDWSWVAACLPMWPNLEELVLSNNSISNTSSSSSSRSLAFPPRLRLINLDCNPLRDWHNVLPFASLPHLETLSLAECQLGDMEVPTSFFKPEGEMMTSSSSSFPSLLHLNLRDNAVSSWSTIAALSRIVSLKEFVLLRNPVMTLHESAETSRQILLVKLPNLTRLNHVYVDVKERRGAQIDYHKKYAAVYVEALKSDADLNSAAMTAFRFEHPTYDRLVEEYGQPEVIQVDEKPNVLKKSLITIGISVAQDGGKDFNAGVDPNFPKVTKKIPASMTVQKVKMMALKAWKGAKSLSARDFQVRVVSDERSFVIDNEMKEISFFGVGNGDELVLTKKMK